MSTREQAMRDAAPPLEAREPIRRAFQGEREQSEREIVDLVAKLSTALGEARERIADLEETAKKHALCVEGMGLLNNVCRMRDARIADLEAENSALRARVISLAEALAEAKHEVARLGDNIECPECHGKGEVIWHEAAEDGTGDGDEVTCPECKGTGRGE